MDEEENTTVDEKFVEGEEGGIQNKDGLSWGFYVLCGCVAFALYELVTAILYFFK